MSRVVILFTMVLLVLSFSSLILAAPPLQGGDANATQTQEALATEIRATYVQQATETAALSSATVAFEMPHDANVVGTLVNGEQLISWDESGMIYVWETSTGELVKSWANGYAVGKSILGLPTPSVQLSPDQTRLLVWNDVTSACDCDLVANIWDVDATSATFGELVTSVSQPDPTNYVGNSGAIWNFDGTRLVTWSRDTTAHIWDAQTGTELGMVDHANNIWGARWNQESSRLLTWSVDDTARVWDIDANGIHEALILHHADVVSGAMWSPDESTVLTWSFDGNAALWDATTGQPLAVLSHKNYIWTARWVGNQVITSSFDGTTRAWDVSELNLTGIGQDISPQWVINGRSSRTVISPDASIVANVEALRVWSLTTGGVYYTSPDSIKMAEWNANGQYLLTTTNNGVVQVYGATSGEVVLILVDAEAINGATWLEERILTWNGARLLIWDVQLVTPTIVDIAPTQQPTDSLSVTLSPFDLTPTLPRSYGVSSRPLMQSFVAAAESITTIDLNMYQWAEEPQYGDVLTVSVLDRNQQVLTSIEQFVPPGFVGWLRLTLPEALGVTQGETYILQVTAQLGTDNPPRWVIDPYNPYADGTGGREGFFVIGYDQVYRLNAVQEGTTLPHMTITPTLTPSPTLTATPQPPPLTATVEAAWYQSAIFASTDPRLGAILQVPTGESLELFLGVEECCYMVYPVEEVALTWSVEPDDFASIDANGVLTLAADAPLTPLTVTAQADNGLLKTVEVYVYDLATQPYIGTWREDAQLSCETGEWIELDSYAELVMKADGRFEFTFSPFEVYVDYIGSYIVTNEALSMQSELLNFDPYDFEGEGTWAMDDEGRLVLQDIWLGTPPYGSDLPSGCGHRFVREE